MSETIKTIFIWARHFVVFILGVWLIIDAIHDKTNVVAKLIAGIIMVGVLPVQDLGRLTIIKNGSKQLKEVDNGSTR